MRNALQKRDIKRAIEMARALDKELKMAKFAPFDAADYLDDEDTIAEYLTAALEDFNPDVSLTAARDVARARGMAQLAKDAGVDARAFTKHLRPAPSRAMTRC